MVDTSIHKNSRDLNRDMCEGASVHYHGILSEKQSEVLLGWSEQVLEAHQWPLQQHKRAMRCIIELLQNLSKHAGNGQYTCRWDDNGAFVLQSVNAVSPSEKKDIQLALNQANEPSLDALRESRLDKLAEGERTKHGGAGLGFMDLRACSNDQVHAEFIPCGNKQSDFVLTVRIHP